MKRSHAWIAGTVAADIAVIALGWTTVVAPARADTSALQERTVQQQQDNAATRASIAALRQQAASLPATQQQIDRIAQQIPDDVELPDILDQLSAAGRADGVDIAGISPTAPTLVSSVQGRSLQAVTIALTAQGSYFALEHYLGRLENLPRAVLVTSLSLRQSAAAGSAAPQVEAQVGLRLFTASTSTAGATAAGSIAAGSIAAGGTSAGASAAGSSTAGSSTASGTSVAAGSAAAAE